MQRNVKFHFYNIFLCSLFQLLFSRQPKMMSLIKPDCALIFLQNPEISAIHPATGEIQQFSTDSLIFKEEIHIQLLNPFAIHMNHAFYKFVVIDPYLSCEWSSLSAYYSFLLPYSHSTPRICAAHPRSLSESEATTVMASGRFSTWEIRSSPVFSSTASSRPSMKRRYPSAPFLESR